MDTIPREVLDYKIPIEMRISTLYREYFILDPYAKYLFINKYIPLIEEYRPEFLRILKEKEVTDEYFMNLNMSKLFENATYKVDLFNLIAQFPEILLPIFFIDRIDLAERCHKIKEDLKSITEFATRDEYEKIFIDELRYDLKNIATIRRTINV